MTSTIMANFPIERCNRGGSPSATAIATSNISYRSQTSTKSAFVVAIPFKLYVNNNNVIASARNACTKAKWPVGIKSLRATALNANNHSASNPLPTTLSVSTSTPTTAPIVASSVSTPISTHQQKQIPANSPGFLLVRSKVFLAMYFSYTLYSITRSTLTFISPSLINGLGFSISDIGVVTSFFPITYGISKLLSGCITDNRSPSAVLLLGLILSAICNICIGASTSLPCFVAFWALNGIVQGSGAGASAKLLTSWFSKKERGFYWALWSTSGNFGGFIAPYAVGTLLPHGWRYSIQLVSVTTLLFAFLFVPAMSDSYEDAGFGQPAKTKAKTMSGVDGQRIADETRPRWTSLMQRFSKPATQSFQSWHSQVGEPFKKWLAVCFECCKNQSLIKLAVANIFVYLVLFSMKCWMQFFLLQVPKFSPAQVASAIGCLEIGGCIGTFMSGAISDRVGGRRVNVVLCYLAGLLATSMFMMVLPTNAMMIMVCLFLLGFCISGPQALIGLLGAELADPRIVATATGLFGLLGYLGATAAGYPVSSIVKFFGWRPYFLAIAAATGGAIVSLLGLKEFWKL